MLKVVNVSKRIVSIGGVSIKPLASHIFTNPSDEVMRRINSLENIGIIKVYPAVEDTAKSRKSKK